MSEELVWKHEDNHGDFVELRRRGDGFVVQPWAIEINGSGLVFLTREALMSLQDIINTELYWNAQTPAEESQATVQPTASPSATMESVGQDIAAMRQMMEQALIQMGRAQKAAELADENDPQEHWCGKGYDHPPHVHDVGPTEWLRCLGCQGGIYGVGYVGQGWDKLSEALAEPSEENPVMDDVDADLLCRCGHNWGTHSGLTNKCTGARLDSGMGSQCPCTRFMLEGDRR